MIIHRSWAESSELEILEDWVLDIAFRPVPKWLGDFSFKYGMTLPTEIASVATRLSTLCSTQAFNTTFVQRYEIGQSVKSHRDPCTNLADTLILCFGTFTGAETKVNGQLAGQLRRGDVGQLPCFKGGVQGPRHEV